MAHDHESSQGPGWTLDRIAAALPGLVGHFRRVLPTVAGRVLSARLRERIMLAVASENRCHYCMRAHSEFGRSAGLEQAEIDRILAGQDGGFDQRTRAALVFARDLASRDFRSRDQSLFEALLEHYSAVQAEAIESTAHVMNFFNRFGNTFDATRDRLSGRRVPDASWLDLGAVSAVFAGVAPLAAVGVGAVALLNRLRR